MLAESAVCTKCKETKPAAEFYSRIEKMNGLSSHCRTCIQRAQRKSGARELHRILHPDRHKARMALSTAILYGHVVKQPCLTCGETKDVEGHHKDYSKPLDVEWYCKSHHPR